MELESNYLLAGAELQDYNTINTIGQIVPVQWYLLYYNLWSANVDVFSFIGPGGVMNALKRASVMFRLVRMIYLGFH